MLKKIKGIYKIECTKNNRVYIGSSVDCAVRLKNHLSDLKMGKHYNKTLQDDFNLFEESSFDFSVVEECSYDEIESKELAYMDKYKSFNESNGYNMTKNVGRKKTLKKIDKKIQLNNSVKMVYPTCDMAKLNAMRSKIDVLRYAWTKSLLPYELNLYEIFLKYDGLYTVDDIKKSVLLYNKVKKSGVDVKTFEQQYNNAIKNDMDNNIVPEFHSIFNNI